VVNIYLHVAPSQGRHTSHSHLNFFPDKQSRVMTWSIRVTIESQELSSHFESLVWKLKPMSRETKFNIFLMSFLLWNGTNKLKNGTQWVKKWWPMFFRNFRSRLFRSKFFWKRFPFYCTLGHFHESSSTLLQEICFLVSQRVQRWTWTWIKILTHSSALMNLDFILSA